MPVFGLGNQHPRDKSAQRQREACLFGNVGQSQRDQQHVEHEEFGGFAQRHDMEPAAHPLLPDEQHHTQNHDGLEQGHTDFHCHVGGRLTQRGNDDQQRHDQQILRQQHAHHFATMRRLQFPPFHQQF